MRHHLLFDLARRKIICGEANIPECVSTTPPTKRTCTLRGCPGFYDTLTGQERARNIYTTDISSIFSSYYILQHLLLWHKTSANHTSSRRCVSQRANELFNEPTTTVILYYYHHHLKPTQDTFDDTPPTPHTGSFFVFCPKPGQSNRLSNSSKRPLTQKPSLTNDIYFAKN